MVHEATFIAIHKKQKMFNKKQLTIISNKKTGSAPVFWLIHFLFKRTHLFLQVIHQ